MSDNQKPLPPAETRMPPYAPLRAQAMGVYPTLDSLQDAIELAESKLPITSKNELMAILMTYHNTLLAQVAATHQG